MKKQDRKFPDGKTEDEILDLLEQGKGWNLVNPHNCESLAVGALARGNEKLAREIKNWR